MEYKLIVAVSGFPSLYDTNSATYRDLSMRGEAWRQISEMVGVPECECRRKWKTLRDQHRRERQRERERRRGGALCSFRPWRFSSILAFLNPFIDARTAGTNGWALDAPPRPPPQEPGGGCSTTTDSRSDEDDYGFAVADATTTSSSPLDLGRRKRAAGWGPAPYGAPYGARGGGARLKTEQQDGDPDQVVAGTDEEEEEEGEEEGGGWRAAEVGMAPVGGVLRVGDGERRLEELLRRMEAREAQPEQQGDDVTLFLLSLAPALRRLGPEKQSRARTRIQQLLHEAEFGALE